MVLGTVGAIAGMGALGGLLGGIGAEQAGRADRRALRQQQRAVQRRNKASRGLREAQVGALRDMAPLSQQLLSDRIGAFGQAGQATDASRAQAREALGGAPSALGQLFSRGDNQAFSQQAPAGFLQRAMARNQERYAPRQAAQESALARALAGVGQREQQSGFLQRGANIDRAVADLGLQQALQQALIDRRYGVESTAADRAAINAQGTGQFMGALGSLVRGLQPAIGYALASRSAAAPVAPPNATPQQLYQSGLHMSQVAPGLVPAPTF